MPDERRDVTPISGRQTASSRLGFPHSALPQPAGLPLACASAKEEAELPTRQVGPERSSGSGFSWAGSQGDTIPLHGDAPGKGRRAPSGSSMVMRDSEKKSR